MHRLTKNFIEPDGLHILTQPMQVSEFGVFDVITALGSLGLFYFDVISDILVAYYMYDDKATQQWFLTTVLVLVLPLIIVNGFSFYWYWFDSNICEVGGMCYRTPKASPCLWFVRILGHLVLHACVLRYFDVLYYGLKSRQKSSLTPEQATEKIEGDKLGATCPSSACPPPHLSGPYYQKLWLHAERDTATVDLLSSLIQDAPQLIVQLYIMSFTVPDQALEGNISSTLIVQLLSVSASFMAMAWSVASFAKAVRLAEPSLGDFSPCGMMTFTLAHYCCIAPQVVCFALFSTKYLTISIVVVVCQWLVASIITLSMIIYCANPAQLQATFPHDVKTGPCSRLDDVFFSAACGLVLLFTFPDVGVKKLKVQGVLFHILRLTEECCMIAFWYLQTEGQVWYHWLPVAMVPTFFVLSTVFSGFYYFGCHPDHRRHSVA
ncbi:XK-related protein 7-like [Macrobrachium nipponense]|uniref:XK-related protein 7-like n=1 Tax=Macrobrachium nipponense TaxID=159736 RepID=UPI0030C7AC14